MTNEPFTMRMTYDDEADAFMLRLATGSPVVRTLEQSPFVYIDVDPTGKVLGVEVLEASRHFGKESLAHLRAPEVWVSLPEAARESGLAAGTLRVLLNKGRLGGRKQGRDWVVSLTDLYNYLGSRAPQGRPSRRLKARRTRGLARSKRT